MQKKRRQHHVWAWHLSAWEVDGVVGCRQGGRIFETGVRDLAVQRDFYRLRELSERDIQFIAWVIEQHVDPLVRDVNAAWLRLFTGPFLVMRAMNQTGAVGAREEFEWVVQNLEEELHSFVERLGRNGLSHLRSGHLGFTGNVDRRYEFVHFLQVQYMRTAKQRRSFVEALAKAPGIEGVNLDAVAPLFGHVAATASAAFIHERWEHARVVLLEAIEAEFVTADQPVVNLAATPGEAPADMHVYFPVSPRFALRIECESSRPGEFLESAGQGAVADLNGRMAGAALRQVFGRRPTLERLPSATT